MIIPMSKFLLASEANLSEHWSKKKKRHDLQKSTIRINFSLNFSEPPALPCLITMTRIAPRELDYDNFVYSLKWIKDTIADSILHGFSPGRADGNVKMKWEYLQEKGKVKEYALKIKIQW